MQCNIAERVCETFSLVCPVASAIASTNSALFMLFSLKNSVPGNNAVMLPSGSIFVQEQTVTREGNTKIRERTIEEKSESGVGLSRGITKVQADSPRHVRDFSSTKSLYPEYQLNN